MQSYWQEPAGPLFLSRKAAKKELMPCDFPGCGRIFSNRQYLNVRGSSGMGGGCCHGEKAERMRDCGSGCCSVLSTRLAQFDSQHSAPQLGEPQCHAGRLVIRGTFLGGCSEEGASVELSCQGGLGVMPVQHGKDWAGHPQL